jgi:hypothetical protein
VTGTITVRRLPAALMPIRHAGAPESGTGFGPGDDSVLLIGVLA